MEIKTTGHVSMSGRAGITISELYHGVEVSVSSGFILGIGRMLYEMLLSKVSDYEKRIKIIEYISASDVELQKLGDTMYKELSGENTTISFVHTTLKRLDSNMMLQIIETYGFAAFK